MRFFTYALILCTALLSLWFGGAVSAATNLPLTYDQIKGTGLANKCPEIQASSRNRGMIPIAAGQTVTFSEMCLEPTSFFVKEEGGKKKKEKELVPGKLLTRATSSLDFVKGTITANPDGSLTLVEKEGLDYQPVTIQLPGGERVAILFTMKGYKATTQPGLNGITPSTDFEGETDVPTYRGANFLDPKGRGLAIGYDAAEALPAKRDEFKESTKDDRTYKGRLSLQVAKVNSETGEFAGTFECEQVSDTDLGAHEPEDVVIRGVFYGKVNI
ncbi:MAG: photosystem II manganese-stabilizing polypeptide [Pseudanabaenaceae cyanobacterium]